MYSRGRCLGSGCNGVRHEHRGAAKWDVCRVFASVRSTARSSGVTVAWSLVDEIGHRSRVPEQPLSLEDALDVAGVYGAPPAQYHIL